MTRTTDDLQDKGAWKGLGEKVERKPAAPTAPAPVGRGPYGIVTGPDGKFRTTKEPPR